MTNYEKFKSMSIDEMADVLAAIQTDALFLEGTINDLAFPTDWKRYLESEVEDKCHRKKQ